jgi:toxin ParE1/3/4
VSLRRVVTTIRADDDVDQALDYYLTTATREVALGFVDALEDAKNLLATHPALGSARFAVTTGMGEIRDLPLSRYPYTLIYTDDPDAVRIHRVLHTKRDIHATLLER